MDGHVSAWAAAPEWMMAIISTRLPVAQLPGLRLVCPDWAELIMRGIESARAPVRVLPRLGAQCHKLASLTVVLSPEDFYQPDVAVLGQVTCLATLDLSGCGRSVSDSCLQALPCLQGSLTSLDVSGCSQLSDQGLHVLKYLSTLRVFAATAVSGVMGEGFHSLSVLSKLSELNISHNSQLAAEALCGALPESLTTLNVSSCGGMCAPGLRRLLQPLLALRALQLSAMDGLSCSEIQESVSGLTGLLSLNISHNNISSSGMCQIASRLTRLVSLDLSGCRHIWGRGLSLRGIANLQTLRLAGCSQLRGADLCHVARLTSLTALDLTECTELCPEAFVCLRGLVKVKSLSVSRCPGVSYQAASSLCESLPNLNSLDVSHCSGLAADGLRSLCGSSLGNIKNLNLSDSGLDSHGVVALCSGATSLRSLCLDGCSAVHNSGLEGLQQLSRLKNLSLARLPEITDAGLLHISSLTGLTNIDLRLCRQLTDNGISTIMRSSDSMLLKVKHVHKPESLGAQSSVSSPTSCPSTWSSQMFPMLPSNKSGSVCSSDDGTDCGSDPWQGGATPDEGSAILCVSSGRPLKRLVMGQSNQE